VHVKSVLCLAATTLFLHAGQATAAENSASPWIKQDPRDYRCVPKPKDLATPPPPIKTDLPAPPQLCADDEIVEAAHPAVDTPKAPPVGYQLSDEGFRVAKERWGAPAARALRAGAEAHLDGATAHATRRNAKKARAAMVAQYGAYYGYAEGRQVLPWTSGTIGLAGYQTIEDPFFNTPELGHSISQFWAIDGTVPTFYSDVEAGWTEDPHQYAAYANPWAPHLFVFNWDGGIPGCYNGCASGRGFFQSAGASVYPTMQLGCCGTPVLFWTQRYGTNWWVNVGGVWVGYFPQSAYPSYFNYGLTTLAAGGEIASTTSSTSCHDMGNGAGGGAANAAHWEGLQRIVGSGDDDGTGATVSLSAVQSDPAAWTVAMGASGTFFRYGGPGYC
jgi:hypothetical protein